MVTKMNDMNLIHGRTITAMVNDNTSVKEMLQMMGVNPTDEVVNELMNKFALEGNEVTMEGLYAFLKDKTVLSSLKLDNTKIASIVDMR
jgi:hypothetical protein